MPKSLRLLLREAPWRLRRAIAWHAGLPFHHHRPAEEACARLASGLLAPATLTRLIDPLPAQARHLLLETIEAGGWLSAEQLEALAGPVRLLRYSREAEAPWRAPRTLAEALVYRGLLLPLADGDTRTYHVPAELVPLLREMLRGRDDLRLPRVDAAAPPARPLSAAEALRHDLALLLLYLHWQRLQVVRGGRLPLSAVRRLVALLAEPGLPDGLRGHRDAPRLWFLTALARQAGLVASPAGGHWTLTLVGFRWLLASPQEQIARLWWAWQPGDGLRWPPPHCPPEWRQLLALTADLPAVLRDRLRRLPPDEWIARSAWETLEPALLEPTGLGRLALLRGGPGALPGERAHRLVTEQLLPALTGLGILESDPAADALRLTAPGVAWLAGAPPPLPIAEPPAPWQRLGSLVLVPWPADLAALWRLFPFASLVAHDPALGGATLTFELTGATVNAGLALRDLPIASLRRALSAGGLALTPDLLPAGPPPRLRQAIWLETADPVQMQTLRADPAVSRALRGGESLSPRHHTVDPRRLDALRRALAALGRPALVEGPLGPVGERGARRQGAPTWRSPVGGLLLAARLWQREVARQESALPAGARPPPFLPAGLLAELAAALSPEELVAVEECWQSMLRALGGAGRRPGAVAPEPDDGKRHLVPLQQAIDRGAPVLLVYEPAGAAAGERVVEPHYLECKRGRWYLHAYCRTERAGRTFRLDRIRELTLLPPGE